jgi:hypothetical protein
MHKLILTAALGAWLATGCSTEATQGAAQGAASGAVAGAVGGMMSALVFGGDVGDAAARGAVWGGSTGAVAGGIRGSQQAESNKQARARQEAAERDALRRRVGDDAYRGLEALAECKHKVAIAYAESAQQESNRDYALAGAWLKVMAVAELSGEGAATEMLPALVERDPKLTSPGQAATLVGEVMDEVEKVRVENGMPARC